MNLKRLFFRSHWIVTAHRPFIRRQFNPILDWEETQSGRLLIERNQWGEERARWTNGSESARVDLAYAKTFFP